MSNSERTSLHAADQEGYNTVKPTLETTQGVPIISNAENAKTNLGTFFAAVSGCILLSALDSTIVTTAFAKIGSDLNQLQRASWIITSYMISLTAFQPLYGKLSDIYGRKSSLLFAHIVFGIGCLACAMANNFTDLIVARMISGIGGAGFLPLVTIAISEIAPLRQRGTWQGVVKLISTLGTASGAPLGGVIADNLGWRWGFAVQVPVCLVGLLAIYFTYPSESQSVDSDVNKREASTFVKLRRIDFLGSLLLIVIVLSLLLALDKGGNVGWTAPITYISLSTAILGTIFLVIAESNPILVKEPVVPMKFFKNQDLVASYLTSLWLMSIGSSATYQLALYLQVLGRKSASQASLYLLPNIIALVTGHLAGGILTQKLGRFRSLSLFANVGGFIFSCLNAAILLVVFRSSRWDLGLIALTSSVTILMFFGGIVANTRLVAVIASVAPSDRAAATSLSFLFKTFGSLFGLSLCDSLLQQVLRAELTRELSGFVPNVNELVHHVKESLAHIDSLDPFIQNIVRQSYSRALLFTFQCSALQSALCLFSSWFIRDQSLDSSN